MRASEDSTHLPWGLWPAWGWGCILGRNEEPLWWGEGGGRTENQRGRRILNLTQAFPAVMKVWLPRQEVGRTLFSSLLAWSIPSRNVTIFRCVALGSCLSTPLGLTHGRSLVLLRVVLGAQNGARDTVGAEMFAERASPTPDTKAPVFIHLSFIGTLEEKQTKVSRLCKRGALFTPLQQRPLPHTTTLRSHCSVWNQDRLALKTH